MLQSYELAEEVAELALETWLLGQKCQSMMFGKNHGEFNRIYICLEKKHIKYDGVLYLNTKVEAKHFGELNQFHG